MTLSPLLQSREVLRKLYRHSHRSVPDARGTFVSAVAAGLQLSRVCLL